MIDIDYEAYCEQCKYFEPDKHVSVDETEDFFGETVTDVNTIIFCKRADICRRMYEVLKRNVDRTEVLKDE